ACRERRDAPHSPYMLSVRPRWLILAAMVISAASTAAAWLVPSVHFSYHLPGVHIAIETLAAMASMLAAFLVAGRFAHRGRLDDLLLMSALGLFAFANLVFGAVPAALTAGEVSPRVTWLAMIGHMFGALVFAAAALVPAR